VQTPAPVAAARQRIGVPSFDCCPKINLYI
jgi:hypothetical protein